MVVALVYFAYLAAMAVVARVTPARRLRVATIALVSAALILIAGMPHIVPLVFLLIGYWLPALLVSDTNVRFEQHLLEFDRRLFGTEGLTTFRKRAPRIVLEYLELAYIFCYAVVPIGFAWLVAAGFGDRSAMFWTTVLLASFGCYGVLPWLATRAPRTIEGAPPCDRALIRKLNVYLLSRASVQWNTFPSGHTAASLATALAVGAYLPVGGLVLGAIALSIAAGSVVGRYHYAADAIAGAVIAVVAFLAATAVHAL